MLLLPLLLQSKFKKGNNEKENAAILLSKHKYLGGQKWIAQFRIDYSEIQLCSKLCGKEKFCSHVVAGYLNDENLSWVALI